MESEAPPPSHGSGDSDRAAVDGNAAGGEFTLSLEPDYCCGGGHCGPLPGYTFECPSCGRPTGCRLGDYLEVGEILTCFLCKRQLRATEQIDDFEYRFTYAN